MAGEATQETVTVQDAGTSAVQTETASPAGDARSMYASLIAPKPPVQQEAPKQEEKPAEEVVEKPEETPAVEDTKADTVAYRNAEYERKLAEMQGRIDGIRQMQPQPKQEPQPSASQRFRQSLVKRGIKVDDEKAEQTFALLEAFQEANFGVDGDTVRAALSKMYEDIESVKANAAAQQTQGKLNKSFNDAVRNIGGEKAVEAMKPQLAEVMKTLKANGGDTDPNRPLNLSPDIILKLADYERRLAADKATADAEAKAKAAKDKNKGDASSTPKPTPAKGTEAGVRLDGVKGSRNIYDILIGAKK